MLTEVMDNITTAMEDNRSAVILSVIDFSKAFNRLQHDKWLDFFNGRLRGQCWRCSHLCYQEEP